MSRKLTITVTLPDEIVADADPQKISRAVTNAIRPYTDELILNKIQPRVDVSVEG